MSIHRVRRVAEVLVASQLRSGRSTADPRGFFGRGISLLLYDALAFALAFYLVDGVLRAVGSTSPGTVDSLARELLPLFPMAALGIVLIAGIMLELTSTNRFATSDAVNWLPLPPGEYVAGSALAIAYSYSIAAALTLGAALAFGTVTGADAAVALLAGLTILSLFEGGLLIEILRSITQRAGASLGSRGGRLALVARIAVVLVVVLSFQLAFNPVLLLELFHGVGVLDALTAYVPLFWGSHAIALTFGGPPASVVAFAAGQVGLVALLGYVAVALRVRYWSPAPSEVRFEAHRYGESHPILRRLGFGAGEASVVAKDLSGLLRRREMAPMLVAPVVLGIIGFLGAATGGSAGVGGVTTISFVAWVAGFYSLLLATTCLGQERRALQNLYTVPLTWRNVFRAKSGSVLVVAGVYGMAWAIFVFAWNHFSLPVAFAGAGLAAIAIVEGTFVGLAFAARYSDFQDRPRPQYLRPTAMFAALMTGLFALLITVLPLAYVVVVPGSGTGSVLLAALGGAAAAVLVPLCFRSAREGFRTMMREMPF